jgi:hypothetical protein
VTAKFLEQVRGNNDTSFHDYKGDNTLARDFIGHADDRSLRNLLGIDQGLLDFCWTYLAPRYIEGLIGATV